MLPRRMRALFNRVRGGFGPRAVILMYHRIAEDPSDPYGLCVSPAHFEEHLAVIRQAGRPTRLADLGRAVASKGVQQGTVCVTFDDGYRDNLLAAAPLLRAYDVPATCFVAAGSTGADGEFWWDELARILLHTERLPSRLRLETSRRVTELALAESGEGQDRAGNGRHWTIDQEDAPSLRHAALRRVHGLLRPLDETERNEALSFLRTWAGKVPAMRDTHRAMDPADLIALERDAPVEVGGHTVSHPDLSKQDGATQRREVQAGKALLEDWLGHAVTSFAYPYGAYGAESVEAVRAAGFQQACTGVWSAVRHNSDPLLLPRVEAPAGDGDALEERLRPYLA